MKEIFKNIKSGIIIFLTFALCSGIYASWNSISKVNSWDKLTSSDWNKILDNMDYLSWRVEWWTLVSAWAVVAFNLQECPSGRKPANWTDWTVDLRWKFIRWLNSFESWQNKLTGNNSDVDWVSRALWSFQNDAIRNITWSFDFSSNAGFHDNTKFSWAFENPKTKELWAYVWGSTTYRGSKMLFDSSLSIWEEHVWADNRPKNIWLIYCEKE